MSSSRGRKSQMATKIDELEADPAVWWECILCTKNYDLTGFTEMGIEALDEEVRTRLLAKTGQRQYPIIVCNTWGLEKGDCTPTVPCPYCDIASCEETDTKCWKCGKNLK